MTPKAWKRVQLASTLIWIGLIWPSITVWRESVPYLVFISVAANVLSSAAGWMAARGEENAVDKSDLAPIQDALETALAVQQRILKQLPPA